ncbi:hypothetical protein HK097_002224 [Rhizophlyctis rosea]|uniref:SH3 domain-containing protein n=1 Tax=Rhizophlyctis rosea TaxID=64517 RepID=A0AAD5S5M9_9FUNG|nr:hypothetical protein HK097_002224 [Rhizophlyctis rosea]
MSITLEAVLPQAKPQKGEAVLVISGQPSEQPPMVYLAPGTDRLTGLVRITNNTRHPAVSTRLAVLLFSGQGRTKLTVYDPEAPSATSVHTRPLARSCSVLWSNVMEIQNGTREYTFVLPFSSDLMPTIHTHNEPGKDISHMLYIGMRMKESSCLVLGQELVLRRCVPRVEPRWDTITGMTAEELLMFKAIAPCPTYIGDQTSIVLCLSQNQASVRAEARYLHVRFSEKITFRDGPRTTQSETQFGEPVDMALNTPTSPFLDHASPLYIPVHSERAQPDSNVSGVTVSHELIITVGVEPENQANTEICFRVPFKLAQSTDPSPLHTDEGRTATGNDGECLRKGSVRSWESNMSGGSDASFASNASAGLVGESKFTGRELQNNNPRGGVRRSLFLPKGGSSERLVVRRAAGGGNESAQEVSRQPRKQAEPIATVPFQGYAPGVGRQPTGVQPVFSVMASRDAEGKPWSGPFFLGRCLFSYEAVLPDELNLEVGDMLEVRESWDDGWALGQHVRTGNVGAFPINILGEEIWRQSAAFHKGLELPSQFEGTNFATLDRFSSLIRPLLGADLPLSQQLRLGQPEDRVVCRRGAIMANPEPATLERECQSSTPIPEPSRGAPPRPHRQESCQPAAQPRASPQPRPQPRQLPSVESEDFFPPQVVAPTAVPVQPVGQSTPIEENPLALTPSPASPPPVYSKEYAAWSLAPRSDSLEGEVEGEMVAHVVVRNWGSVEDGKLEVKVGDKIVVLKELDNGWCVGKNNQTNKSGLFPLECITPLPLKRPDLQSFARPPAPQPQPSMSSASSQAPSSVTVTSGFVEKFLSTGHLPTLAGLDQALIEGDVSGPEYLKVRDAIGRMRDLDDRLVKGDVDGKEYVRGKDEVMEGLKGVWP